MSIKDFWHPSTHTWSSQVGSRTVWPWRLLFYFTRFPAVVIAVCQSQSRFTNSHPPAGEATNSVGHRHQATPSTRPDTNKLTIRIQGALERGGPYWQHFRFRCHTDFRLRCPLEITTWVSGFCLYFSMKITSSGSIWRLLYYFWNCHVRWSAVVVFEAGGSLTGWF